MAEATASGNPAPQTVIRMTGTFSMTVAGSPVTRWRAGKARMLLQYLLVHRCRVVSRSELVEALWPDGNAPETSLKVAVHALRSVLDGLTADGAPPALSLESVNHGYRLTVADAVLDLAVVEDAVRRGTESERAGRAREALRHYRVAVQGHGGGLLEDEHASWIDQPRQALDDLVLQALVRLMRQATEEDDHVEVVQLARQALRIDRCHQEAYRMIMISHARAHQPGRARRWYDLCARTLRDDLDVGVEPATHRLLRRILAGEFATVAIAGTERAG